MAQRDNKRRSARQLAGRKRASIYYEPDSDDDFGEDSDGEQDFLPELEQPRKRQKRDRRSKPQTRSAAQSRREWLRSSRPKHSERKKHPPTKRLGAPMKRKEKKEGGPLGFKGPSDGRKPDWTSLPIEILRDIFIFASQPVHEQTTTARYVFAAVQRW